MTNTELIEQIRQGTPLENDIDDISLLRQVLKEAAPNDRYVTKGGRKYYVIISNRWYPSDEIPLESIKLSAFKPKMVSVDELLRFVDYKESMADFSIATDTLRAFLLNPELLTQFLNEKEI